MIRPWVLCSMQRHSRIQEAGICWTLGPTPGVSVADPKWPWWLCQTGLKELKQQKHVCFLKTWSYKCGTDRVYKVKFLEPDDTDSKLGHTLCTSPVTLAAVIISETAW